MKKRLALIVFPWLLALILPAMAATPLEGEPPLPEEISYVMLKGVVTSYGGAPAAGWMRTYAVIGEGAEVHTIVLPSGIPEEPPSPEENFTYSFLYVRLDNASIVELNYTGLDDLYISGVWSVYNVTFNYYGYENFTLNIETVVSEAPGEMLVTNEWSLFTISIQEVSVIAGRVRLVVQRDFEIPQCDVVVDGEVNLWDLMATAQAYGTTPGLPLYDFELDFNFDFVIDIYDLLQLSIELGKEY